MHYELSKLIGGLCARPTREASVITWACPVPVFGNPAVARVATLGLNPSNLEFLDRSGAELDGVARRLHTLRSLGLESWDDADARHLMDIAESCCEYFVRRPYSRWFNVLDRVLAHAGVSYYGESARACHLDLVPYATATKWMQIRPSIRADMLEEAAGGLGRLVRDSTIEAIILNGQSVVSEFSKLIDEELASRKFKSWTLCAPTAPVAGVAYVGVIDTIADVDLGRCVTILGFNHNLQSSFGVTQVVLNRIGRWIADTLRKHLQ